MGKIWREWKWVILAGLVILVLALVLRLYHLTLLPIFADEAIYVRWAQVMRAEPSLRFLPLSDGKQPLFMWSVIPFLKIFSDPLFAGRFVSVASGIGTLVGIFVLSYLLFKSRRLSLVACLLYAISPFSVFFDRMALVDSMLTMFGVWTLVFGLITVKTLRLDFAMMTGFALGGALLTKSPALFFAILLPTTWLLSPWPKGNKKKIVHLIKLSFLFLIAYLLSQAMYNILRLGPNFNMIASRNSDYVFPISHLWTNPRDPFVFLIDRSFEWIRMMGPWMVLVLWLISYLVTCLPAGKAGTKYRKEALVLTAWFIVPILVQSEFAKVFTARYILFSLPYLFVLAASSFLTRTDLVKRILVLGLMVLTFQAAKFNYLLLTNPEAANLPRSERSGYLEEWTSGYGIKEVADYLRTEERITRSETVKNPGTKIVVGTEGYFGTLPDGLQMYLNDKPEITVVGTGLDFKELPTSLKESKKSGNKTYLVVNKSRFKGNPGSLGLILIGVYPKALRQAGTKEYVIYGPQDALLFFELTEKSVIPETKAK